jgi:hypothetical protein
LLHIAFLGLIKSGYWKFIRYGLLKDYGNKVPVVKSIMIVGDVFKG